MAPMIFQQRKRKILSQLDVADEQYSDQSPKGSLDTGILELVRLINSYEGLVTTSSCSGRASVFLEGKKAIVERPGDQSEVKAESHVTSSTGGKGGGRWLFVSHDPILIPSPSDYDRNYFHNLFGLPSTLNASGNIDCLGKSLVHFKFEAMILHIMSSSITDAEMVLSVAQQAGFRESGIMSLGECPMIAVRCNGLGLDSIIAYEDEDGTLSSLVTENYLLCMATIANERFSANIKRILRFQSGLTSKLKELTEPKGQSLNGSMREDRSARRERKRQEGLAQQKALQLGKALEPLTTDHSHEMLEYEYTFSTQ